jgi:hypothetical protein
VAYAECSTLPDQVAALSAAHQEVCMAENKITKMLKLNYSTMKNIRDFIIGT